jgi:iron complex outermembrane receptor protein
MRQLAIGLVAIVAAASGAAQAQVEEIVVTARKQAENLQDVPLTVTAFTAETIEAAGIQSMTDLQAFTPGLNFWQNVDRGFAQIMFRGMSNSVPTGDTSREAASVFLDGIYFIGNAGVLNFEDIERVEVVKGPQSAFFGRATFGGAVNFVSKTPGDTFGGRFNARIAEDRDYEVGGSVEGPLVAERLRARVSANYREFGGQYRNPLDGRRVGEEKDQTVAVSLYATPSDDFNIKARVMYQRNDDGPAASALIGQRPQHNCGPFGGTNNGSPATLFCGTLRFNGRDVPLNNNNVGAALAQFGNDFGIERDFYFYSLAADYTFAGGWNIASLTGYSREAQDRLTDFDRTGFDAYGAFAPRRQKAFSQELRLATPQDWRLRGLVGVYYLWQDYVTGGAFIYGTQNPVLPIFRFTAGTIAAQAPNSKVIRNSAVFGAASFDLTDTLTFSFEGRYQRDRVVSRGPGLLIPSTTKTFLPRFIIDYKPNPDTTIYFNVARGNKPTQANQDIATQPADKLAILATLQGFPTAPEEKIWNYELGAKSAVLDGRGLFNIATYVAKWTGKQGTKSVQFDFNRNGIIDLSATGVNRENFNGVVYPAGDVTIYGVEAQATAEVTEQLTAGLSVAYNGNNITKLEDDLHRRFLGTSDASDKQEPRVSRWSGNATLSYRDTLTGDLGWFARVDQIFIGSKWESILNRAKTGDAWKTNVKLGVEAEQWTITLFADNLFNNKTLLSLSQQGDSALDPLTFRLAAYEAVLPRLRQFGVTANYRF